MAQVVSLSDLAINDRTCASKDCRKIARHLSLPRPVHEHRAEGMEAESPLKIEPLQRHDMSHRGVPHSAGARGAGDPPSTAGVRGTVQHPNKKLDTLYGLGTPIWQTPITVEEAHETTSNPRARSVN